MKNMGSKTDLLGTPKDSMSHRVYDYLLDRLLRNELVPGNLLNRREIAAELGVSVAPVLEALVQLELEGFVESIPRKGTLVRPVQAEDIFGLLMLREAMECQAARLYCGEPIRKNRDALNILADNLELTEPAAPDHWKAEIELHCALVALSNCHALDREFRRFIRLGVFYRMSGFIDPADQLERFNHRQLLDRLSVDDPDLAEKAIRDHVRSGKGNLLRK